eukprot:TRINITY_DN23638_c0_g1_i1.p1 TRINITY_DN23638_c0_g1~~TRINITY_DN23638_c0_g1_i1.p1  ORF type:complete len:176 (-),score=20.01 TRINITY_DN23638_c0_g1_i1:1078-1605(-)
MFAMACSTAASTSLRSLSVSTISPRCSASGAHSSSDNAVPSLPVNLPVVSPLSTVRTSPVSSAQLAADPSSAFANILWFRGPYNVQVNVEEREPPEVVVRKFRKEMMEANIVNECRRRRYHENAQDTVKRKQKDAAAARRRGRKSSGGSYRRDAPEAASGDKPAAKDEDNWSDEL